MYIITTCLIIAKVSYALTIADAPDPVEGLFSTLTFGFGVHQREADLSGGGVRASSSCNSRHRLQREKRLSFEVVAAQSVVVQNCHQQARSGRLALV